MSHSISRAGPAGWLLPVCLVAAAWIPLHADTAPPAPPEAILSLALEAAGIEALLASVLPTLEAELGVGCGALDRQRRTALFDAQALLGRFTDAVAAQADGELLEGIAAWYDSEAGQAIARHEAAAAMLDEASVERRFEQISARPDWPQRAGVLRTNLKRTGTAPFLARFHNGVDGAIAALRACRPSSSDRAALAEARAGARQDEPLVAFFMQAGLVAPSAVIYEGLSDGRLQAYDDFALSAEGQRWFAALRRALGETWDGALEQLMVERTAGAH